MTNTNIVILAGTVQRINDWSKDGKSNALVKVAIPVSGTEASNYIDVVGWSYQADAIKRLSEGDHVVAEGSLESYTNKSGETVYRVKANRVSKVDAGTLNKAIVQGRLSTEPEIRSTKSGKSVANFNVAVDRSYRRGEEFETQTTFIKVVVWGDLATNLAFKKGQNVWVEGVLRNTSYTDKNGVQRYSMEITAESVTEAGTGKSKTAGGTTAPKQTAAKPAQAAPAPVEEPEDDGELPF